MTPQEERNKRLDTLFNSLGYDHVNTCTCGFLEECKCVSGRDRMQSFLQSEIDLAISDYQTNFEQKHIASAVRNLVEGFVHFIDRQINCLEKEIDYMQKHSKGNYADGKVEAFTKTIDQLTLLKELYE